MDKDTEPTTVIFRKESGGDILAVFPYEIYDTNGNMATCYAHVGQHSGCDWGYITKKTTPATPAEYADLKRELESLGYLLEVRQRRQYRQWRQAYEAMLDNRRQAEITRQDVRDFLAGVK